MRRRTRVGPCAVEFDWAAAGSLGNRQQLDPVTGVVDRMFHVKHAMIAMAFRWPQDKSSVSAPPAC